mmetsp:Transcript_15961/g.25552  ORF Transcript_15961/g.25552 Transcript_15961/m.25552 type:complete len:233 (-) Transcript_15961:52-750(-)
MAPAHKSCQHWSDRKAPRPRCTPSNPSAVAQRANQVFKVRFLLASLYSTPHVATHVVGCLTRIVTCCDGFSAPPFMGLPPAVLEIPVDPVLNCIQPEAGGFFSHVQSQAWIYPCFRVVVLHRVVLLSELCPASYVVGLLGAERLSGQMTGDSVPMRRECLPTGVRMAHATRCASVRISHLRIANLSNTSRTTTLILWMGSSGLPARSKRALMESLCGAVFFLSGQEIAIQSC